MGMRVCVCAEGGGGSPSNKPCEQSALFRYVCRHLLFVILTKVRVCLQARKSDRWNIVFAERSRVEQTVVLVTKDHPVLPAVSSAQ